MYHNQPCSASRIWLASPVCSPVGIWNDDDDDDVCQCALPARSLCLQKQTVYVCTGTFYIGDTAGEAGADNGYYCTAFGAQLPVTVSSSA